MAHPVDRREFLQASLGAAAVARLISTDTFAQTPTPATSPAGEKLIVDAYSRHLQWLRSADEVAEAALEMGYEGLDITVQNYPGHVDPTKVAQELPPFVNTVRKHGLTVRCIRCAISDADSPNAEAILAAASSVGITHYWGLGFQYQQGQPVFAQLDAFKPRMAKIAALNEKYKMTGMFHTYAGGQFAAAIWDALYVLRNFDPAYVGFHYDAGHQANHGSGLWQINLRAAREYVRAVSVKDFTYDQNLGGLDNGGGPFTGTPAAAGGRGGGARGGGAPGGARGGGRGGGADAPINQGLASATGPTANGWRTRQVPLGTGVVSLPALGAILKEIGFNGPIEVQAEYPNGGANNAQDKITLPRAMVLGAMKRDLLALRRGFAASGLL